jgi:hypothetical protein
MLKVHCSVADNILTTATNETRMFLRQVRKASNNMYVIRVVSEKYASSDKTVMNILNHCIRIDYIKS